MNFIQKIQNDVKGWRDNDYKVEIVKIPEIRDILHFQKTETVEIPEIRDILHFQKTETENQYKYLRKAQFEAIETYLFLRFVKKTPRIVDLYKEYCKTPQEFCKALDVNHIPEGFFELIDTIEKVLQSVNKKENQEKYKYHSLIETLNLEYPSYILALAMGSGKTNIISSIIAIEFAIAIENENKVEFNFMQNALVFAPGLTILKNSLKKISILPFEKILPPEMCKKFLVNVKYIQADNKKELNVTNNSKWNVVIMNSEKIILKNDNKEVWCNQRKEEKKLLSNHRLERIKSLPNLGIFSDEAHHTYGNKIGDELKKVRETINHINKNKELICVVNTTGTPYADKKMLKDVVFWYGLEEGIKDGILKSLHNGIKEYSFNGVQDQKVVVADIINDFFSKYDNNEKIAFYFKSENHLEELKKYIEQAVLEKGLTSDIIFKYTLNTKNNENEKEFLSLDNPENKKRILLLIGMGKEGWDCKTLFATALISEVSSSNNYILQASTRCLRQIEGNIKNASIYLSRSNAMILNKELEANYKTSLGTIEDINPIKYSSKELIVKKPNPPKLEIKVKELKIIEDESKPFVLKFEKPNIDEAEIIKHTANLKDNKIQGTGEYKELKQDSKISLLLASNIIATNYHLKNLEVLKEIQKIYEESEMPEAHLSELFKQIDKSKKNYKEIEEITTRIIAIIKTEEGFQKSEDGKYYYHTIKFKEGSRTPILKENNENSKYGFHYEPYNFDSKPESDFFEKILYITNSKAKDIEDIYFTGGLTTPDKTDFHFQYKGKDGKFHEYYPDFMIKKKNGELYIVEIKSENQKGNDDVEAKAKAINEIAGINEGKIKYAVIYTNGETVSKNDTEYLKVSNFIV